MKFEVLVLNSDYLPHRVTTWQDAFVHIYSKGENSAHILATYPETVEDSMGRKYNIPAVIALNNFVKSNNKVCSYSKHSIHIRDKYTCQYCGIKQNKSELTVDHVIPKSKFPAKGSAYKVNSFENVVSCCQPCNSKKADRTPKEANMQLRTRPVIMTKGQKVLAEIKARRYPAEWKPYIEYL